MNLTDFITQVRWILDDPTDPIENPAQKYSDQMIVTLATQHVQSLARVQAQRDQGFHNFAMALKSADATQVFQNVWQWALPVWVMNVVSVRWITTGTAVTGFDTFSPYRWAAPPLVGDEMPRSNKDCTAGWAWDGNRTIRVYGGGGAPDLMLQVAKTPARLWRATLDLDAPDSSRLFVPATVELGTEDGNEGAAINAEVQVLSVADTGENVEAMGETRRVIYSKFGQIVSGDDDDFRRTTLYFEEPYSARLVTGDKVETCLPLGEEHVRLLCLKVAWSCFERTANIPGQKAIAAELGEEFKRFEETITPRDTQAPGFWLDSAWAPTLQSSDRATYWRYG